MNRFFLRVRILTSHDSSGLGTDVATSLGVLEQRYPAGCVCPGACPKQTFTFLVSRKSPSVAQAPPELVEVIFPSSIAVREQIPEHATRAGASRRWVVGTEDHGFPYTSGSRPCLSLGRSSGCAACGRISLTTRGQKAMTGVANPRYSRTWSDPFLDLKGRRLIHHHMSSSVRALPFRPCRNNLQGLTPADFFKRWRNASMTVITPTGRCSRALFELFGIVHLDFPASSCQFTLMITSRINAWFFPPIGKCRRSNALGRLRPGIFLRFRLFFFSLDPATMVVPPFSSARLGTNCP